jgi:hypothetical protein
VSVAGLDRGDGLGGEDLVERGGVSAVSVADQEPEAAGPFVEVHDEVAIGCREG